MNFINYYVIHELKIILSKDNSKVDIIYIMHI